MLATAYSAVIWNDTITCQRATLQLCWPLIKQASMGQVFCQAFVSHTEHLRSTEPFLNLKQLCHPLVNFAFSTVMLWKSRAFCLYILIFHPCPCVGELLMFGHLFVNAKAVMLFCYIGHYINPVAAVVHSSWQVIRV